MLLQGAFSLLFAGYSSAFFIEVESRYVFSPARWLLCRSVDPPLSKYEPTVFAIDPTRTSCEKQDGSADWFWYRPAAESDPYDKYKRSGEASSDPRTLYLGGNGRWEPQDLHPIIFTGSVLNQTLELGTVQSDSKIPARRDGQVQEITPENEPEFGDRVEFYGHELLVSEFQKILQIDLVGATDAFDPRYAIFRGEIAGHEDSSPVIELKVVDQRHIEILISEARALEKEAEAKPVKSGNIFKNMLSSVKTTVADKVKGAKNAVTERIKAGLESGLTRVMGDRNSRTHVHAQDEESKQDYPVGYPGYDSNSPDPTERQRKMATFELEQSRNTNQN
ncbi:hypothetical protein ABW20_dc0100983 [Dactylellina cionopaga]|nr:hypothetical protein ABW20_dc0100983 [Dactylellina cionopaga]